MKNTLAELTKEFKTVEERYIYLKREIEELTEKIYREENEVEVRIKDKLNILKSNWDFWDCHDLHYNYFPLQSLLVKISNSKKYMDNTSFLLELELCVDAMIFCVEKKYMKYEGPSWVELENKFKTYFIDYVYNYA